MTDSIQTSEWPYEHRERTEDDDSIVAGQMVTYRTMEAEVENLDDADKRGLLHSDTGPAVEWEDGSYRYYEVGVLHRDGDQPAITEIDSDGLTQYWVINGKVHREHGPALIRSDGHREWCRHGKLHRDGDLPAGIAGNGDLCWFVDGLAHREGDQPAFIGGDCSLGWWWRGRKHRDHGRPACIEYLKKRTRIRWYEHGEQISQLSVWENGAVDLDGIVIAPEDLNSFLALDGLVLPDAHFFGL
jgi:hypothetical protein